MEQGWNVARKKPPTKAPHAPSGLSPTVSGPAEAGEARSAVSAGDKLAGWAPKESGRMAFRAPWRPARIACAKKHM